VRADVARDDLCTAIGSCNHGFKLTVPEQYLDAAEHPVYAYAIDSAGGANTLLTRSPLAFNCDPPASPDAGAAPGVDAGAPAAADAGAVVPADAATDAPDADAPDADQPAADPVDGEPAGPERVVIGGAAVGCQAVAPGTGGYAIAFGLPLLMWRWRARR
jgi:hypothetical protein